MAFVFLLLHCCVLQFLYMATQDESLRRVRDVEELGDRLQEFS
jgi:hypothetical protein